MADNRPIGIYDSGLGGLTVWREVRRALPGESLAYLGDGANCPYGSRPREEVQALADAAVARLVELDCKMVVVACNTATAAAIGFLREKYAGMPIVGMEPAVKPACLATRSGVVGVLATERSLDGELFRRTAARYGSGIEVLTYPGTGFVELVEGDREDTPEAEAAVRAAVEPMLARGADQIVLGCTHYPFLTPVMERIVDGRAAIVDPSPAVARRVGQLLDRYGLRASADNRPALTFRTFADELIVDGRAAIVDPSPAVARRVGQLLDRYGLRASADNRPALTFRTFADELYRLRLERKVAAYL